MQNQLMRQIAQRIMQTCNPQMRQIIQSASSPEHAIQMLCDRYPEVAKQIDTGIGRGLNPRQEVINFTQNPRNFNF